jgi:hypothetical protein
MARAHTNGSLASAREYAGRTPAEAEDWRLRHRSILDALPWREREAWLAKIKAAAFERAQPRRRSGGSWAKCLASVAAVAAERLGIVDAAAE